MYYGMERLAAKYLQDEENKRIAREEFNKDQLTKKQQTVLAEIMSSFRQREFAKAMGTLLTKQEGKKHKESQKGRTVLSNK